MKPRTINGKYNVILTDELADWDALSDWEKVRFASMEANLSPADTLFDIGTEMGALSAVYASWIGGNRMCLFEPSPEFWPNIRAIWEANHFTTPMACWAGLLADTTELRPLEMDYDPAVISGWPSCAWSDKLSPARSYRYIHEHGHSTPRTTLDDWVAKTGIIPTAITMDVEGAETFIVVGATQTLATYRPLTWISVHPDLIERDGYGTAQDLYTRMIDLGYEYVHLGTDHEEHVVFWHPEKHDLKS